MNNPLKKLDRLVALAMVAFFVAYLYLNFTFDLLPFERRMSFKPNTMPQLVGILGLLLSLLVLFTADGQENKDNSSWRTYDYKSLSLIALALFFYSMLLKTLGFIVASSAFIFLGAVILGEKKYVKTLIISIIGSISIWLIVDKLLGIYLSPIPSFIKL